MFDGSTIKKIIITCILSAGVYFIMPASVDEPARRMASIFVIAALFWALEVVPLYTTSLLVVLLEIFLLCRPGGVMDMSPTGYQVFLVPFGSPVIMLFFGGLMLAAALRKYHLDKYIAVRLLKIFGQKPYMIMLGFMSATAFLSMWMSNTATTAMMVAMVLPLLNQIEKDDPFRKGLILSIPFAANIGGIGTPIGTPPNAIAIGIFIDHGINITFTSWMMMALPLAVILLFAASAILRVMYPPRAKSLVLKIKEESKFDDNSKQVSIIALLTIGLWLTSAFHKIPSAIIALLSVGMLFSFKLLDQDDMKKIDWDILVLMWGGLALGKGMEITGLTDWIVHLEIFQQHGLLLIVAFCFLAVFLSTFISNTATANLLLPIVMVIPGESQIMLAITVALSCSFAMALPISTPPNAIAFSTKMIRSEDMLKAGALISVISVLTVFLGFKFVIAKVIGVP